MHILLFATVSLHIQNSGRRDMDNLRYVGLCVKIMYRLVLKK